ncbi:MAG: GAK system ATP-grasp enzyme [Planctomycetes bacterium]|nr:GAK system ATP-grasp enzyme [Planctomycetota bacterium]
MKIAVVGIENGWSSMRLADEVGRRTDFRLLVDLKDVVFDTANMTLRHKGRDLAELDGIIVKKIAETYSPDCLDKLLLLHLLEQKGVRIFSKPMHMLSMLDRLACTTTLLKSGIPMPETILTENEDEAFAFVLSKGKAVAKPLFSTKSRGMRIFDSDDETKLRLDIHAFCAGNPTMYIQKLIDIPGRDLGVTFLGGKYLATYARVKDGKSWSTSTSMGGRYENVEPSKEIRALSEKAQSLFDLDFTCVDVVETGDGPMVFEVSALGGFRGLQDGCNVDAARLYADYVIKKLGGK